MAASALATLPLVILFFCMQRAFLEGITLTGIKG
jgi:multiple sugar transport system permease protein